MLYNISSTRFVPAPRIASYFPHFAFTVMAFDPIRDVQPTVDLVDQLRQVHSVEAPPNQPSRRPDFGKSCKELKQVVAEASFVLRLPVVNELADRA